MDVGSKNNLKWDYCPLDIPSVDGIPTCMVSLEFYDKKTTYDKVDCFLIFL
jgi:hypothetical protein